ncbi:MAG: nicotinate-nucleotide--dimethylbenzimidazole phosphoribosyltransferase [Puniceicoccaceae bacterium 5H]|nr:MAG: nicotinate-nucleotide--dimethylbenzimidazole phosphoribosyltransferase [Puniceicoccaceae bacterium 5H]
MPNTYADFLQRLQDFPDNSVDCREFIAQDWNTRTKPPGSLGRLEPIATWVGEVQHRRQPQVNFPALRLFAGAHGIAAEGVSMCPEHVNAQMVRNFANGGAAINALCRSNGIDFKAYDAGVDCPTANFLQAPAMSEAETVEALLLGWNSVPAFADLFAVGEMGIGNTTPSAAILAAVLKLPVDQITGRGAGLPDDRLAVKIRVIEQALENRKAELTSPLNILASIGGREIAAMTGAMLSAASQNIPIVLDGVISAAAACIAFELEPRMVGKCIAGHRGAEPGQQAFLRHYQLDAVVDLAMRLGEGTGAAVAMGVIHNAVDCLNQMATFESAGVQL